MVFIKIQNVNYFVISAFRVTANVLNPQEPDF